MVAVKTKPVVTMKFSGSCPTHSRTDVSVRDVEFTVDEPKERDGTNLGPTPTETLVGALMGCTNVISNKIAAKHGIRIDRMDIDVEAQLDRRGVMLEEEIDVPFPEIKLMVNVVTDADKAAIDTVKTELQKYCAISKVIRQAGTKIVEEWTITRP